MLAVSVALQYALIAVSSAGCEPGVVSYGTNSSLSDGFTIGLRVLCEERAIQLSVLYTAYQPNWFGIVFNDQMAPSPDATVFTTGKVSETQRELALYAYALNNYDVDDVVYHEERNWRRLSQHINDSVVSLTYEQDLSRTLWSTSTESITFRYAWGSAQQGTQLQQHGSTATSTVWTFNLETGHVVRSNTDGIKTAHALVMVITWSFLATFGIFSSRYRNILYAKCCRNQAVWFFVHRAVQILVVVFALVGLAMAVYFTQHAQAPHFSNKHEIMGLTVVCLAVVQVLNACLRPHTPKQSEVKSTQRLIWEIVHKSLGYAVWIAAQITIIFGLPLLTSDTLYMKLFLAWILFVLIIFVAFGVVNVFCWRSALQQQLHSAKSSLLQNDYNAQHSFGAADCCKPNE